MRAFLSGDRATFDRITDLIYIGSRISTLDDYHRLRAQGVRACVDMKEEGADPWTFEAFLWLPTADHDAPTQLHLRMGIAFLRQCEKGRVPAYVHCMAGVGRSSTLVLAHLLAGPLAGRSVDEVLEFMCARRACVNPNARQVAAATEAAAAFRD